MSALTQLSFLISILAILGSSGAAAAETRRFAVVVAHDQDLRSRATALEYADDDAARYAELLDHVAGDVSVLAVLDPDTQRLFPQIAARAEVPSLTNLQASLRKTFAEVQKARDEGHKTIFYFVLIGHGDIGAGGEGYVSLADAPFTRTSLFRDVLKPSPAHRNHVIVDACNSYYMVHRRGTPEKAPDRAAEIQGFLSAEDLARYPNTGFLLSTSSEKESHEWSRYRAGVFSHQLRSALLGGADVNQDGRVEYSEVQAFVASANVAVSDRRARVELYARPPRVNLAEPLVDLGHSKISHWLRFDTGRAHRVYLEDARGVRYADLHLSGESSTLLALLPSRRYFVRSHDGDREVRLDLEAPGEHSLALLRWQKVALASRGAVAEAFRSGLYAEPYGPAFYRGFVSSRSLSPVTRPERAFSAAPAPVTLSSLRADRELADRMLARLNRASATDSALRDRLRRVRRQVADAASRGQWARTAELLNAATAP